MSRLRVLTRDPLALALAALVLGSALFSVEMAGWMSDLPRITFNGLGAMALAYLLLAIGLPWYWSHLAGFVTGILFIGWQAIPALGGHSWSERLVDMLTRLNAWGYAARTGGVNTDPLAFFLLLLGLAWLSGYTMGWSTSRGKRPWGSLVACCGILLLNLNYGPPRLGIFFLLYSMAALLLIVRLNLGAGPAGAAVPKGGQIFTYSAILALSLSLVAWFAPTPRESTELVNVWYSVNSPWQDGLSQVNRLFAFLVSKERTGPGDFDSALVLRNISNLSDDPVMVVESSVPRYWRGLSYDTYTGQGWLTQEPAAQRGGRIPLNRLVIPNQSPVTKEVTQTITMLAPKNNLIFGAGQLQQAFNVEATAEGGPRSPLTLTLANLAQPESLPNDVRPYAGALSQALRGVNSNGDNSTQIAAINARMPRELRVTGLVRGDDGRIRGVQVATDSSLDVTAVYAASPLQIGQKYTVLSSVNDAPPDRLREAGTDYPSWVKQRYLQLPPTLPERVRTLASRTTESATNPYDKALAVEAYLRTLTYSTILPAPTGNVDRVDYLLFTIKRGYSAYFSTAMAVMLRSVGVPAREVTGYTTGSHDPERGGYLVKESNAHGWVEVYFPRYGWIEFEPTPSLPALSRTSAISERSPEEDLPPLQAEEEEEPVAISGTDESAQFTENPAGWPLWSLWLPVPFILACCAWAAWRRRWSGLDPAVMAYGKLAFLTSLARCGPGSSQTPGEYLDNLQQLCPRQRDEIGSILIAYERVRYGGRTSTRGEAERLLRGWQSIRGEILRRLWLRRNR